LEVRDLGEIFPERRAASLASPGREPGGPAPHATAHPTRDGGRLAGGGGHRAVLAAGALPVEAIDDSPVDGAELRALRECQVAAGGRGGRRAGEIDEIVTS